MASLRSCVFSVLKRYSLLQVQLRIEGSGKAEVATPFVFVGNNRYESRASTSVSAVLWMRAGYGSAVHRRLAAAGSYC